MTTAEAINEINSRIELANRMYVGSVPEYIEALEMAIEAMQKQEPMKPTYDHRYADMGCSMCGSIMGGWEELPNYCPNCGQKIDWEKPGECGMCGVKVKDLHPYKVGQVHSMICGNCKSIVNMGG